MGRMLGVFGAFQPPPPPGAGAPVTWGREDHVREELGAAFDLTIERRLSRHRDESPEHAWEYFAPRFGPTKMMLDNLEPERRAEFERVAREHFERARQPDGSFLDEREYLLVTGERR